VAILLSAVYFDHLARLGEAAITTGVEATRQGRILSEQLTAMERHARQYAVLQDDALLELFDRRRARFEAAAEELRQTVPDPETGAALAQLLARSRAKSQRNITSPGSQTKQLPHGTIRSMTRSPSRSVAMSLCSTMSAFTTLTPVACRVSGSDWPLSSLEGSARNSAMTLPGCSGWRSVSFSYASTKLSYTSLFMDSLPWSRSVACISVLTLPGATVTLMMSGSSAAKCAERWLMAALEEP
jgi:hypothetical protein